MIQVVYLGEYYVKNNLVEENGGKKKNKHKTGYTELTA